MTQLYTPQANQVLFLCTGNYYRSRFAEVIFSTLAEKQRLPWTATSRGLRMNMGVHNIGPISPLALAALGEHGISLPLPIRHPVPANATDFQLASVIIGMDESEHRQMIVESFPQYADRIEYWHIHDLDRSGPEAALTEVETQVRVLVGRILVAAR
ncbi:MAG: low molecular weight phosphatase family protein [Phycisphaerae bacterium]|nr:low molecular weight phosphatase family protein [Phycisphaerae bacterium]